MEEVQENVWIVYIQALEDASFGTKLLLIAVAFLIVSLFTGNGANVFKLLRDGTTGVKNLFLVFLKKYNPKSYFGEIAISGVQSIQIRLNMSDIFAISDGAIDKNIDFATGLLNNLRQNSNHSVHVIMDLSETESISINGERLVSEIITNIAEANIIHLQIILAKEPTKILKAYKKKLEALKAEMPTASWSITEVEA